jgi:hypothetical protein
MNSTTTKKYYKYVPIEKIQIQISTRFEVKQNIHNKMFALFYDKDDELISERLARTSTNKMGEETYLVYDSDITNEKQSENDLTKAFTDDINDAMDLYLAGSYMMDKINLHSVKTTIKCAMYKITYLDSAAAAAAAAVGAGAAGAEVDAAILASSNACASSVFDFNRVPWLRMTV